LGGPKIRQTIDASAAEPVRFLFLLGFSNKNKTKNEGQLNNSIIYSLRSPGNKNFQDEALGPLPEGWEERIHNDGRIFYIDHSKLVFSVRWYSYS